ncbi:hypothetical protein DFH09DRAFT_1082194 [Mycena vulgaris]|nr:hypothetical protein DFH09DRAFT_1082194 [Mycena vulgaris]
MNKAALHNGEQDKEDVSLLVSPSVARKRECDEPRRTGDRGRVGGAGRVIDGELVLKGALSAVRDALQRELRRVRDGGKRAWWMATATTTPQLTPETRTYGWRRDQYRRVLRVAGCGRVGCEMETATRTEGAGLKSPLRESGVWRRGAAAGAYEQNLNQRRRPIMRANAGVSKWPACSRARAVVSEAQARTMPKRVNQALNSKRASIQAAPLRAGYLPTAWLEIQKNKRSGRREERERVSIVSKRQKEERNGRPLLPALDDSGMRTLQRWVRYNIVCGRIAAASWFGILSRVRSIPVFQKENLNIPSSQKTNQVVSRRMSSRSHGQTSEEEGSLRQVLLGEREEEEFSLG